jgi:hypothetical protein
MSDSAEGSAPKAAQATGEGAGSIAPEEAERLAEGFVPSWQFDQAGFTPGVMSAEEMERLAAPTGTPPPVAPVPMAGAFAEEMTASDVDMSGMGDQAPPRNAPIAVSPPAAPPASALAPAPQPVARSATQPMVQPAVSTRGTLMMAGGPPAQPPPAQEPPRSARPKAPPPQSVRPAPQQQRPQQQRPRRPAPATAQPSADDTGSLLLLKRSYKGPLLIAGIGLVAAIAIFVGVRSTSHDDSPQPTSATAAPPPPAAAHTEESAIPPPPPAAEPATAAATPEAIEPAPAPKPQAAPPPPPPPRPAVAVAAPRQEAPRTAPVRPAPAAPPKSTPKSGGGGIVRDNPF